MGTSKSSPYLNTAILEVVDNQIRENNPPETKLTYERLLREGHTEEEAKRLIGSVVATEIFHVLRDRKEFDKERFVNALNMLPHMPREE